MNELQSVALQCRVVSRGQQRAVLGVDRPVSGRLELLSGGPSGPPRRTETTLAGNGSSATNELCSTAVARRACFSAAAAPNHS